MYAFAPGRRTLNPARRRTQSCRRYRRDGRAAGRQRDDAVLPGPAPRHRVRAKTSGRRPEPPTVTPSCVLHPRRRRSAASATVPARSRGPSFGAGAHVATTRPEVADAVVASAAVSLAPAPALHAIHLLCVSIRYVQDQLTCPSPSPSCDPPPLRVDSIYPRSAHLPQPQPFICAHPLFEFFFVHGFTLFSLFLWATLKSLTHPPMEPIRRVRPQPMA